ncbi:LysE family transporter [Pelagibius marinus]|uniref:LysE family transporter n=1 Tax=Pelagibius marinus TaxID=2762760 RepID=UPI0018729FA9|nr:LysE family transporter [Pelagibius marinus]
MIADVNLPLILLAALIATGSPGPATLAIAGTSMASGRPYGLALAAGVTTGSLTWSIAAAAGLSVVMLANAWAFEMMRYIGAGYLLFLAVKSARAALRPDAPAAAKIKVPTLRAAYRRGLLLHLTNPKAILFFGALYSVAVPANTSPASLALIIAAIGLQSVLVFHGYALLFSSPPMTAGYAKLRRWFEAVFALAFGAAGLKILTTRLG